MSKCIICLDMFDDTNFNVKSEHGYVKDFDLILETNDKQLTLRLTRNQAYDLIRELREQL